MSDTFDWSRFLSSDEERERHPIVKWDTDGKTVKGTVVEVWEFTKDDKTTPVVTLDTDRGKCSVFVSQVDLRSKVAERDPQVGDKLGIRFDGTETLESGRTMKRFTVRVDKAGPVDPDTEPF